MPVGTLSPAVRFYGFLPPAEVDVDGMPLDSAAAASRSERWLFSHLERLS